MPQAPNLTNKQKTAIGGGLAGALALSVAIVAPWEGKRNDPYLDIVNVKTVCYGETENVENRRYSDKECSDMLVRALERRYMVPVLKCTPSLSTRPEILASATSLAYNIGVSAYCKSTVDKRFDAGDYAGGCKAFMAWVMAGGKRVQGLVNRRNAERKLCEKGLA